MALVRLRQISLGDEMDLELTSLKCI